MALFNQLLADYWYGAFGAVLIVLAFLRGAGLLRVPRWALWVPGLLLAFVLLVGCAHPPYPDSLLAQADPYISAVAALPFDELQRECGLGIEVSACTWLTTGEIYLLDHPSPSFRECILRHERSHIYEVYVLQLSIEQTQAHEGWITPACPLPR